jgi:hypothetical protein
MKTNREPYAPLPARFQLEWCPPQPRLLHLRRPSCLRWYPTPGSPWETTANLSPVKPELPSSSIKMSRVASRFGRRPRPLLSILPDAARQIPSRLLLAPLSGEIGDRF